jgi:hypothetical protein
VRAAENLREMMQMPERDAFFVGNHDTRVAKAILAILP